MKRVSLPAGRLPHPLLPSATLIFLPSPSSPSLLLSYFQVGVRLTHTREFAQCLSGKDYVSQGALL